MTIKSKSFLVSLGAVLVPAVAFAQKQTLSDLIHTIVRYLNQVLFLLMGAAVVMFTFYVIKYFIRPNEERKEASSYVMYSVIGFFIILSFWGLVNILQNTFGLQNDKYQPSSWESFTRLFPGSRGSSSSGPEEGTSMIPGFQQYNSPIGPQPRSQDGSGYLHPFDDPNDPNYGGN